MLSVSPTRRADDGWSLGAASAAREARAFLTPRVLDQSAFDELAGTLRGLLDDADRALARLAAGGREADEHDREVTGATARLQERLRLGARMLKAFQTQIDRAEGVIGAFEARRREVDEAEAHLAEALGRIESAAGDSVGRAMERLDEAIETALERAWGEIAARLEDLPAIDDFTRGSRERMEEAREEAEGRLRTAADGIARELRAQAAGSAEQIESVTDRLRELEGRAGDLAQHLETAEVDAAVLCHRAATASASALSAKQDVRDAIEAWAERARTVPGDGGQRAELARDFERLADGMRRLAADLVDGDA